VLSIARSRPMSATPMNTFTAAGAWRSSANTSSQRKEVAAKTMLRRDCKLRALETGQDLLSLSDGSSLMPNRRSIAGRGPRSQRNQSDESAIAIASKPRAARNMTVNIGLVWLGQPLAKTQVDANVNVIRVAVGRRSCAYITTRGRVGDPGNPCLLPSTGLNAGDGAQSTQIEISSGYKRTTCQLVQRHNERAARAHHPCPDHGRRRAISRKANEALARELTSGFPPADSARG